MGDSVSDQDAHQHYDQIASNVPCEQLGAAIGPAMSNLDPSDVQRRVANFAAQTNTAQRGNLFQTMLGGVLSQLSIDPSVQNNPQNASPEELGKVAAHTQTNSRGAFHKAMEFYSEHPALVKALSTAVIGGVARHLSQPS